MKKSYKYIIVLILILAGIIGCVITYKHLNRTIYNDKLIYGNTAGNFYNGGLFCEANGYVYFSNPYDEHRLYRMTPSGTEAELLMDDTACFINADNHYVYYARSGETSNTDFAFLNFNTHSLCRLTLKNKKIMILDEAPTLYASLINNDIYYIHYDRKTASTLYKVGIDGKNKKKITSEPLFLAPGQEGTLCYAGVSNNHNIALWNPITDAGTEIYQGVCYQPIDTENYIYFMNAEDNYSICRYNKSDGTVTTLVDCRVDCYNLTDEYLYYQKNDIENPALCRIKLETPSSEEIVMQGNYSNIHVTSKYVYFNSFLDQNMVFQTPANGDIQVNNFTIQEK